jgi:eukaryotic-like serine/threonine-protein kinase
VKLAGYRDSKVTVNVRPNSMGDFAEVDFEKRPGPKAGEPWENGLGMKFVPVGEVLFAAWPTRVADFIAFAEATGFSIRESDFPQTPDHPVINVNWEDAKAFCVWLTATEKKAGRLDENQSYRLPTDAEWSSAAGIPDEGGNTPEQRDGKYKQFLWGTAWPPPPGSGNFADASIKKGPNIPGYSDGWVQTSPVASFKPMASGLYDMTGNVWQWVEDSYRGGQGRKTWGVLRGGSWGTVQQNELHLGYRDVVDRGERDPLFGFRCVIDTEN